LNAIPGDQKNIIILNKLRADSTVPRPENVSCCNCFEEHAVPNELIEIETHTVPICSESNE